MEEQDGRLRVRHAWSPRFWLPATALPAGPTSRLSLHLFCNPHDPHLYYIARVESSEFVRFRFRRFCTEKLTLVL